MEATRANRRGPVLEVRLLLAAACLVAAAMDGPASASVPTSYDLRNVGGKNYMTSVKAQSPCSACWAFATYGALESYIKTQEYSDWPTGPDFSENDLKNNHGFDLTHCAGGNIWMSAAHLSRLDGPVAESDDPYNPHSGTSTTTGPRQRFLASMLVGGTPSKSGMMSTGAMHVSMYWNAAYYCASDSTYYYSGTSVGTNHAVVVAGWDDNKATASPNPGAWLVKDCKGTGTHNAGYFWISYDDTVACKTSTMYQTAANDVINVNKCYCHDYNGRVAVSNETLAANVFTTGDGPEDVVRVGIYAEGEGQYLVEVYSGNACTGGGGGLGNPPLGSTIVQGLPRGYKTTPITDDDGNTITLPANSTFTVMVTVQGDTGGANVMAFDTAKAGYCSGSTAGAGESYFFNDNTGQWEDLYTYNWPGGQIQVNTSNWCIKAFTIPEPATMGLLVLGAVGVLARRRRG